MDPLDFLESEELLRFFHVNKTELSCMENPHTFITQLRDHYLIPEDSYKKMKCMKSKDNLQKALYEALDWLEREQSHQIKRFWGSVFKDIILNLYPVVRLLRNSLMDGSFHCALEQSDKSKQSDPPEDEGEEEKKMSSATKKRKQTHKCACDDEGERKHPSTPAQRKKSKKISFSSPLKKGEKSNIWTWAIYKHQLPITCGQQKGILNRDKLAKGERCMMADKQWFTPSEFEKFSGKESFRNWKQSIRCMDTPLGKLIQEGHLKAVSFKTGVKKAKKSLFKSSHVITVSDSEDGHGEEETDGDEDSDQDKEKQDSSNGREASTDATDEEEEEEQMEQQHPEVSHSISGMVLRVTCGALAGTLHTNRFASDTCGKSIRTETRWMTPVEFVKEASDERDPSWRTDIKCEGKPLSVLIEANILTIHSDCACKICRPSSKDLEDQKNDDKCCICRDAVEEEEEGELVVCDHCPRSFHKKCHLPHVEEMIIEDRNEWICTFCVFKKNRGFYYQDELTKEEAMSRQMSQHMLQCQYLFLCLCSEAEEESFSQNPKLYLSNYSRVAYKLQRQLYKTVREFVSDVQLIFTNGASYSRENAEFLNLGNTLKRFFDEQFNSVFNILV